MPGIILETSKCVIVESVWDSDIFVRFDDGYKLKVSVGNGRIICGVDLVKGDRAELITASGNIRDVKLIRPFEAPRRFDGQITYSDYRQFALVDDKIVIYDTYAVKSLTIGEKVNGTFVEGDYYHGNDYYVKRSIDVQRKESVMRPSSHNVRFRNAGPYPYPNEQYDVPCELYKTIKSNNVVAIWKTLNEWLPREELTMDNIGEAFHALLYLEEIEINRTFETYILRKCPIVKEKKMFSIPCNDIEELRPPISRGDMIDAVKLNDVERYLRSKMEQSYYRGKIQRIHSNRFIVAFVSDHFENDWNDSEHFYVQFHHNRTICRRMHAGMDAALHKFDERMFFPTELVTKPTQIDVKIEDGSLFLNADKIPWFNKQMNDEQKSSVMLCLRAECRPLPFIIFGPPGTGKTSTLVETILQIYTHLPDSRILIATQSNSAANVVSARLLSEKNDFSSIDKAILRLVSNATIDKKKVPESLFKICASISLSDNDEAHHEDSLIKRKLTIELMKKHRIVISTCGAIGSLVDKHVSFTHVFIDEASQCHEPEALVPISMIDPNKGQIILAGDPLQLPPIVLSNHAKDRGLGNSMLERYIDRYGNMKTAEMKDGDDFDPRLVSRLYKNYRALPSILKFYSDQFYKSLLVATINKDNKETKYLEYIYRISFPDEKVFGIRFYNVNGENRREVGRRSWHNPHEAKELVKLMQRLIEETKAEGRDIGITTPYYAQVLCFRKLLEKVEMPGKEDIIKSIKIGTVEEYQGEERRIILFSAVKTSGDEKALRFVHCAKRLNTAMSRGRNLVVIFGNAEALSISEDWSALIEYCKMNGSYIEDKKYGQDLAGNDD